MPIPLAALVALGVMGSAVSAGIANQGARRREENARWYNKKQWEAQNLYNTPIQQMQRLQEGGLNPNLIYGQSPAGAAGNAGPVAPGKAAPFKAPDLVKPAIDTMLASQDFRVKGAQYNNEVSQNGLILAEEAKTLQQAKKLGFDNQLMENTLNDRIRMYNYKAQSEKAIMKDLMVKYKVSDASKAYRIQQEMHKASLYLSQFQGQELKNAYQSWKNELARDFGFTENDNAFLRMLSRSGIPGIGSRILKVLKDAQSAPYIPFQQDEY